jgi:hypothetical protein
MSATADSSCGELSEGKHLDRCIYSEILRFAQNDIREMAQLHLDEA